MSRLIRRVIWCSIFLVLLWLGGLLWFGTRIPSVPPEPGRADAIVVLTGGKNRLEYGLQLLAQEKAPKLFVSGVHEDITEAELVKVLPPSLQQQMSRLDENAVTLGREAWNTIGNAEETKRWLTEHKIGSILLVTSNYHMPRSYYEFRHLVKGVTILPASVPAQDYSPFFWWATARYRMLVLTEYHKYLFGMFRNALIPTIREL